jgi:two-component sensor histidine kinase
MLEDGTMYFFTGNKAFIIDPARVDSSATQQFQLKLQEMVINGKAYDWNNAELLSGLRYKQNRIVFRFGLLNFINQKNVRYYYYLEGLENEWNENINPGEVSFTSLPPGKYVFHLKCTDISDNMLAKELTVPFRIDPPFWQTWWFRALGIILVISVLYWFFKRRIRAIKTKAALNLQLSELEEKALRAQMNPHFIFNSLNAIQELIVTQNFTEAYQYLSSFSKLLWMVLNNSEKNFIPFSSELEMIQLYLQLESLRFKQSFQYDLEIDPAIDENTVLVPPLLLQPFIENAIWHGLMPKQSEKKLHISFHLRGDHLVYTVEDNGIGRKKAAAIKSAKIGATHFESKGITLSQHRIQILNQQLKENLSIKTEDLKDDEEEALGTHVTITIPRQQTFIK